MKIVKWMPALLATLLTVPVFAQNTDTPKIDQRQANQQKRIDQGVQSGALTQQEAANLQKRQDKLAQHEQAAKADGVVTAKERHMLKREEDRNSRAIYRKKHNGRTTH